MNVILKKKHIGKKIQKKQNNNLNFCSPFIWKKIFLFKQNKLFKTSEKLIYTRSSVVPYIFCNSYIDIYSGKRWHNKVVNKWMVGFKFGEFTWNRKLALYKAKQLKKKKKK